MNKKIKNKKFIAIFIIFILMVIFHKWQVFTSNNYLRSGDYNSLVGNYTTSLNDYKYAAVIDGNRDIIYQARIRRAEIFLRFNQLENAQNEINSALRENKYDHRAYEIMGDIYYKKGDILNAIKYYNKAIDFDDKESLNIKLAKSLIANNQNSKASELLLNLFSQNDNNIEITYLLGLLEFYSDNDLNDYFERIETSENDLYKNNISIIEDSLKNKRSIKNKKYNDILIAGLFNKINEPYFAINKTKEVIKLDQSYRDAWIELGKSYFVVKDYNNALDDFNRALELDSNNPEILFWIARVYEQVGNNIKSAEYMERYSKY
ncbi:MAG: tetratricopeptide repeat protein [Candidatus Pacebacteria bacterium]|nr:tetratricopeptide repeat protein [Candidatus Paceibacterota bacterium]